MSINLNLPFDESEGSLIAYDYSPSGFHADVVNGEFVRGREGNCVYFPSEGYAVISGAQPIDFTDTFTMWGWFMADPFEGLPTVSFVLLYFRQAQGYLRLEIRNDLRAWTHITIVKSGNVFSVFVNGKLSDFFNTGGTYGPLSGFSIQTNGINSTGYCMIDNVNVINGQALSPAEIGHIISNAIQKVNYYINGRNFDEFGLVVSEMRGILSRLETKTKASYDWPEYHGRVVDLSDLRFEPRKLELDCWFTKTGKDAFIENIMELKEELSKSETIRIMIELGNKPLIYECYMQEEMDFDVLKWRDGKMFANFTLKFIEPEPVKRILMFTKTDENITASITLKPESGINIYWGDGSVTNDVFSLFNSAGVALPNTITHTYANNGPYYIVMSGVIEDIDQATFAHNAVQVWKRLF